ncbi:hypothetical protein DM01DRAFT_1368191 [Hesseltinella vesiculosa]|uniref:SET domain-containing protein n=1 Tax=Hesseltinella vesiculosa TaxID=101127 RepID=A0A1X2G9S7_9FUNG|nr:hypothetical protein DM01DRAFT_1368191 [Hesseltinella vesiculosa]
MTSSHPGLFHVERKGTASEFSSRLVADRAFATHETIVSLDGVTPGEKRYSTVQISPDQHIELNSDLLYLNHACDPTTFLDVDTRALIALKPIAAGDELTFFYPSTEWDMAQSFDCWCGSPKCIKTVKGARHLSKDVVLQFELAKHIQELLQTREK